MIKPIFHRQDELHTIVEIPVKSSQISTVRTILTLHTVPQVLPGGHGWQFSDGAVEISGSHSAVVKVTDAILYALNGPKFTTGLELAKKQKKGAMS